MLLFFFSDDPFRLLDIFLIFFGHTREAVFVFNCDKMIKLSFFRLQDDYCLHICFKIPKVKAPTYSPSENT